MSPLLFVLALCAAYPSKRAPVMSEADLAKREASRLARLAELKRRGEERTRTSLLLESLRRGR